MTELRIEEGVSKIPAAQWNALVGDASPFLEWEWLAALEQTGSNVTRAARRLSVSRRGLQMKMKDLGISIDTA